jgi:hypothetical protein
MENMASQFDINRFRHSTKSVSQYEKQLDRLIRSGKQVDCIEDAVRGAVRNLRENLSKSFVIYGEPQSGKTEMMICLTGKLLDEGFNFIVHMLNDSVDLLNQNLGRFKSSGLAPSARNFSEVLDPDYVLKGRKHVIFCKKNASDLAKLKNKIGKAEKIVVVDDEADYASPNSKVNKGEKTRINKLIGEILEETGIYIGVTATPARLDLNNTFENDNEQWVNFPPHKEYTGQDTFFPIDEKIDYLRTLLPDKGDDPKYAREAFFRFLVNVAFLNKYSNKIEECYSMLVHTSGKKADHSKDWKEINKTLEMLNNQESDKFENYVEKIWQIANEQYPEANPDVLTDYIVANISRHSVIVINSDKDKSFTDGTASNPSSLFTIIIGGNIVSRGVTFNNLLSMFFTRDVKNKIQQDTYIQRARMFGSRGSYLKYFELTIPEQLYLDWHRCFVFHRLALAAINAKLGSPVWLADSRIQTVATSSIDKSTVDLDKGEMSFAKFKYDSEIIEILESKDTNLERVLKIAEVTGGLALPDYLIQFIHRTLPNKDQSIFIRQPISIQNYKDADHEKIVRKKGLMGQLGRDNAGALHNFGIFFNDLGMARVFYKFDGSIQFIKNIKND